MRISEYLKLNDNFLVAFYISCTRNGYATLSDLSTNGPYVDFACLEDPPLNLSGMTRQILSAIKTAQRCADRGGRMGSHDK